MSSSKARPRTKHRTVIRIRLGPVGNPGKRDGSRVFGAGASEVGTGHPGIQLRCVEIPLADVARILARRLGCSDSLADFSFNESTGDLVPNGSFLLMTDGARRSFTWRALRATLRELTANFARNELASGFLVTGVVVNGFTERWCSGKPVPKDTWLCVLLEKFEGPANALSERDLFEALVSYARNLPDDFDRSFINSLPCPSPSEALLSELIRRGTAHALKDCLSYLAVWRPGIALQWTASLVGARKSVVDPALAAEIEAAAPGADFEAAAQTWAENLLAMWTGE